MSQWGLLSWEPDLDIWGKTNSGVKVSVSDRTSILFHKARATMMIWKQETNAKSSFSRIAKIRMDGFIEPMKEHNLEILGLLV